MNHFKKAVIQTRHSLRWLGWVLALLLGYLAQSAQADQSQKFQYHYTLLWWSALPGYQFTPVAIDDSGRVYGDYYFDAFSVSQVAVFANGSITPLHPGNTNAGAVNARGTIGGFVFTDPVNFKTQAALFRRNSVTLIPFQPGETNSQVVSLDDSDTALVSSVSEDLLVAAYRLYNKGKILFNFQSRNAYGNWGVNNLGMVSGGIYDPDTVTTRAMRFQPPYRKPQFLAPLPTDRNSFSWGINNLGYVLGVSQNDFDDKIHYGIWDLKGKFKTYYEGINYTALFNDSNLIVLSGNGDIDRNSYIIPKPGERFNLMKLVDNPAAVKGPFDYIADINNRGDMVGYGSDPNGDIATFLLRRVLPKD